MIQVLCATNRPEARSRQVAKHVFERLSQMIPAGSPLSPHLLDLADLKPDIFSVDSYAEKPDWFLKEFQEPISNATGILVVTPEYNGGFPGVMKYFIDMLKFPESLVNVPTAFIGVAAGQFGALRSVEQLEVLFHYRSSHLFGERLFVPKVHEVLEKGDGLGSYEERLESLLKNFTKFVENHRKQ